MEYYQRSEADVFTELGSGENGLSQAEARKRLRKYGLNTIKEEKKISKLEIFINQFKSVLIAILLAAAVISAYLGYIEYLQEGGMLLSHMIEPLVILLIVIANAIIGFNQEYRAEEAINALKKLTSLKARVLRKGSVLEIPAAQVVPGDILVLETGDKIAADARIIESIILETQEASLTGESIPVKKSTGVVRKEVPVGDQKNMVFSSTIITKGRGKAIVTGTGMKTQIGKIAKLIGEEKRPETPLQKELSHLAKWLGVLTVMVSIVVFGFGTFTGKPYGEMFLLAVALAVAAIPEGLPAIVSIALAQGIKRLAKKHSLIRKLPSVETLGSVNTICCDKTGTLTKNEMTVQKLFVNDDIVTVTGTGYKPTGTFSKSPKSFDLLLKIGMLCNDAALKNDKVIGDPTEGALLVSGAKAKLSKERLEKQFPRIHEIPFDGRRKMMTTIHQVGRKKVAYTKGAPDMLLKQCNKILVNGRVKPLTRKQKKAILKINNNFASEALRVLGFAYKPVTGKVTENSLIFVGLQGMIDPPRPETKAAIEKCTEAGIRVIVITGDHQATAQAIAAQIGLTGKSITGEELDKEKNLGKLLKDISIFARVTPEHKLKIIQALKRKKQVVAMTGDGVNDAPALKKADIGIAMGRTGTDVAKEASEMILTRDNFSNIVTAVEEGRRVYANIRKAVFYLLSSNIGEILTIFVAIMLKWANPLLAIHILWINLVTDSAPALALGVDPKEPGIMKEGPRSLKEKIISKTTTFKMLVFGTVMMLGTLGVFTHFSRTVPLELAQTLAFTTLVLFQMFNVLNSRSMKKSFFKLKTNRYLFLAIGISVILQVLVVYTKLGQTLLRTASFEPITWIIITAIAASVFIVGELIKLIQIMHDKVIAS